MADENYQGGDDEYDEDQNQPQLQNLGADDEEEDDDFPEFANESNKQIKEIIREKKRVIKDLTRKYEEKSERAKILQDHLKNVQQELLHTQSMIDAKNKEIESEDHLKQVSERIIGRLVQEQKKLEKLAIEQQEKLNDVQNQIFKGNEKMDQYKLEMNWNQEELEQWALAARQKEEDNLTLEKYKRADLVKIKELNLTIQNLTLDVSKKQSELDKEITETQAAQIELDKTAEEFKKQHEERHQLFIQWQEVTEMIASRDASIRATGEEFAKIKMEINANKDQLQERQRTLKSEKMENKKLEANNELLARLKIQQIKANKQKEEDNEQKQAQVEILKNQVSAFATDLSNKRNAISVLTQEKLMKKQRLNAAQQKYNQHIQKLKNEELTEIQFKEDEKEAEAKLQENEEAYREVEKDIKLQEKIQLKETQQLFKLREKEASLYSDIQEIMANSRNLQAHIVNLNQDFQKQQELLYNAEYQIQLMERKVNRAKGERTLEEKNDLQKEIKEAEEAYREIKDEHEKISESLKKLDDDLRSIEKKLRQVSIDQQKYDQICKKLQLENDMTYEDLQKIVKKKEDVLVSNDTMKLEIKKIRENLSRQIDKVMNLENRKYQLEMSMQEREKEIQVHKDVLVTEHKAAEQERHKIAVDLAERKNKVKNLKIKYEALVQKNVASNGEVENVQEHSQAYYIIKAAQEREELQRKGDELNAKILKSEKELKALENTLQHLGGWNNKYYESFQNKGVTQQDRDQKEALDEQTRAASENLFKKKKELQNLQKNYEDDQKRFTEYQNKIEILYNQEREVEQAYEKLQKEIEDQDQKIGRAEQAFNRANQKAAQNNLDISESNQHITQLYYDRELMLTKTIQNVLFNLAADIPEISNLLQDQLGENFPSKAPSSLEAKSVQSGASQRSGQSRGLSRGSRR